MDNDSLEILQSACTKIGDNIKNGKQLSEDNRKWLKSLDLSSIPEILIRLRAAVKQAKEKLPPEQTLRPEDPGTQQAISMLDSADSFLRFIHMLRDIRDFKPGIESAAARARYSLDEEVRYLSRHRNLTQTLVQQTLKAANRPNKDGAWVQNDIGMAGVRHTVLAFFILNMRKNSPINAFQRNRAFHMQNHRLLTKSAFGVK